MNPGMKVKLRRIELGLTQQELSKKISISNKTVLKIERGEYKEIKLDTLINIAKELKLDFTETFLKNIE